MSDREDGYVDYVPPSSDELYGELDAIYRCWEDFIDRAKGVYSNDGKKLVKWKYDVDDWALKEMIVRVNQRKDYFYRYHSHMSMSEYKEIGLNMFWLTKFHPFRLLGHDYDEMDAFGINEEFAMFYMLSSLKAFSSRLRDKYSEGIEQGKYKLEYNSDLLTGDLYDEIRYTLSFRDVSKEVLGVLVELVANIVIPDLKALFED